MLLSMHLVHLIHRSVLTFVAERFPRFPNAFLPSTQCTKVLRCFGNDVEVELECDPSLFFLAYLNVEVNSPTILTQSVQESSTK